MTTLVILLNPRARIGADATATAGLGAASGAELFFVLTPDGLAPSRHGRATPALMPKADSAVVVVPELDVSWNRLPLPKAPPTKLRAAIAGALEERVIDEPERMHFAIAPHASAGQPTWIASVDKAWLKAELSALDKAGIAVERAVPMAWPEATPLGHFGAPQGDDAAAPMQITWSDANGVLCLGVNGALARQMLPQWSAQPARWTAHPAVAAPAERWLGSSVLVLTDEQRLLQAMRSLWNLLQFDLAAKHRGAVALRDAMRRWKSASWRPVRWGVAALVALQVAGLNLYAWHQERQIVAKREAMTALLRATHPQVRNVLDAPAQMQRETDLLRAAAGRIGDSDLETLLGVAAAAWPDGQPPLSMLRFENGRLSFSGAGWSPQQVEQFRAQLNAGGIGEWSVAQDGGTVVLSRAVKASS